MKRKILLLATVILLTGCSINVSDTIKDEIVNGAYINLKDIKVFEEVTLSNIISDTNVEILNPNTIIDTESIDDNYVIVEYKYNNNKYKYKMKYKAIDDVKPIVLSYVPDVYIRPNDMETNPCDSVNMGDNYSRIPTCEIIGDYDINKLGTYKAKYQIKDESNNIVEKDLNIHVVNEYPKSNKETSNVHTITHFSDIKNKYKNENTEIGLDISKWQGEIDFNKVKEAGVEFVIMRIGVATDVDEEITVDTMFNKYIEGAKNAGLKVGVYVFTSAINEEMGKEAADFVINALNGYELDLPVAFDWENWSKFRKFGASIHDINKAFIGFSNELEKNNLKSILYSSKYYLNTMWEDKVKNNYQVWLAHYTDNTMTDYEGKYNIWQLCNDGSIDGINSSVDIDILFK